MAPESILDAAGSRRLFGDKQIVQCTPIQGPRTGQVVVDPGPVQRHGLGGARRPPYRLRRLGDNDPKCDLHSRISLMTSPLSSPEPSGYSTVGALSDTRRARRACQLRRLTRSNQFMCPISPFPALPEQHNHEARPIQVFFGSITMLQRNGDTTGALCCLM
ncbi:hypothetical protein BCV70DRAFT_104475 [Testicularia cyperi]|uniref:Uncharacterized protein n=1 Tax=Testicularia cyperi TaxID=1882483 RepID=A0A317XQA6_9BASI|nr:hypothetical protein BCV70DRAFT_104475 [Testicularia cyperi]